MGGRHIDDHKFFAGAGSPRFPKGVHLKEEHSEEGAGMLKHYEDSSEAIASQQKEGDKKAKAHPMKPGHRY